MQPLEVLHEGDGWLAIDKPSGISLLADRSGARSLWDALGEWFAARGARPLLVHRLDKGTSGVLLLATHPARQAELTRLFQARRIRKFYLARVVGALELDRSGSIDLPLRKGRKSRYRVAGSREAIRRTGVHWRLQGRAERGGLESHTRLRRLVGDGRSTLVLLAPGTGRTHQVRVHLAWIGHAIVGDHLYGKPEDPAQRAPRLALHCHRLVIPMEHGVVSIRAPAPTFVFNNEWPGVARPEVERR